MSDADVIGTIAEKQLEKLETKEASQPDTKKALDIVENFLRSNPVMCYGGTAINNLLKPEHQFYDFTREVPDYDFYSKTPQQDAMKIADTLEAAGIPFVQVKPGIHLGTFKVFADFNGVADITHMDEELFDRLWKEDYVRDKIHYVPPNFLRMSMYLELSRPEGDVSRWNKVYARLMFLNDEYPMVCKTPVTEPEPLSEKKKKDALALLRKEDLILLGFNASERHDRHTKWYTPVTMLATAETIIRLTKGEKTTKTEGTEILPARTDVIESDGSVVFRFYETQACHSYHTTSDNIKVASIPTILQFFFAYVYSGIDDEEVTQILCVAQRLMEIAHHESKRRHQLLTPTECIGHQESLKDMLREKTDLYDKLGKKKDSPQFLEYFFTYVPKTDRAKRQSIRKTLKKLKQT
jgi:hypothetical protein